MNVNLTPNITGTKVNVTKGYSKADLDNSVSTTKYYRDEAEAFKNTSSANATTTTTKANEASISATNALNSANTATTQAGIATNSANIILGSEAICISNAAIAASKALEASNSASSALDSKNSANTLASNVSTSESNALSYKNSASSSASSAISSANTASIKADEASSSAITAINQATIATTKANEASNSAINASASEAVCIAKATIATDNADIAIAQAVIATNKANTANTSANTAITKASEASISANQALTYKNQLQEYVIPAGTSYSVDQINTQNSAMTKAQLNAVAEERKANRAGSGFEEWGLMSSQFSTINEGMWCPNSHVFYLGMSSTTNSRGVSKTINPVLNINGNRLALRNTNNSGAANIINVPTAPTIYPYDTVLTTDQIDSGVIKHADSSNSGLILMGKNLSGTTFNQTVTVVNGKKYIIEYKDNGVRKTLEITASSTSYIVSLAGTNITEVGMYPLDAISRSDLAMAESFHEDIAEKGFGYPFGNVQYLGGNTDGLTGIANGSFTGFETYSLFGNWQTQSALIGKGYVWNNLTEAQKRAFIANPENNCYLDGDKTIQVRYRVRVVQGLSDNTNAFSNLNSSSYLALYELGSSSVGLINAKGKKVSTDETKSYANRLTTGSYLNMSSSYGECVIGTAGTPTDVAYEGKCFALPIALVHRRNQGMYHPVYNPNGTKKASDENFWYNTAVSFTSISDCFDPAKLLTASGYIGTVSGRPDGLFYDQIHESDILDLRNSSKKVEDYNRLINREFNKLVAGTNRGKEGEWYINKSFGDSSYIVYDYDDGRVRFYTYDSKMSLQVGDTINVIYYNGSSYIADRCEILVVYKDSTYSFIGRCPNIVAAIASGGTAPNGIRFFMYSNKSTRTKSNTLLHCDIIGNPTNYPTSWKESGVFGTPLIVAEDGTSLLPDGVKDTFKLSRDANATPLLCLRSTDSGATWTSFTPTFSTTTNEITLTNEPATNLVMVYYQTKTIMAVPVVNSEVLEMGDVIGTNGLVNGALISTLIGKVPTANTAPYLQMGYDINGYRIDMSTFKFSATATEIPLHSALSLAGGAVGVPAVKVFPYLTRLNVKAYLNLVFKEMKHNGTSWGDSNKFEIVDNVSTTTDNNAQTVLIGQKTVELPYFIGADE